MIQGHSWLSDSTESSYSGTYNQGHSEALRSEHLTRKMSKATALQRMTLRKFASLSLTSG